MSQFLKHWEIILKDDNTHSVDIVSSIHENGINQFLEKSHEIDKTLPEKYRKYNQTFERTFDTFDDPRKFRITLSIAEPLRLNFSPYTENIDTENEIEEFSSWTDYEYFPEFSPALIGRNDVDEQSVEIRAPAVTISLEWDRLDGEGSHEWKIPPFEVLGLAQLELHKADAYYIRIIPKQIKLNIKREQITNLFQSSKNNLNSDTRAAIDECEEKFNDLFIIAANIAAYEQTPKLVTSIELPALTIEDRPVVPAIFDISNNIMSVGFGLDRTALDAQNESEINAKVAELNYLLSRDIELAGGMHKIVFDKNRKLRSRSDQQAFYELTSGLIAGQEKNLKEFHEEEIGSLEELTNTDDDMFAIGINEYFLDSVANSVIPKPSYDCTDELEIIRFIKGKICWWVSIKNPDFEIEKSANLKARANIDIGGEIHACVKRFWDCSWRWECGRIALALVGRPAINAKVLKADGIRIAASVEKKNLGLVTNLPTPFKEVAEFFFDLVLRGILAFVNILALLLSYRILKPKVDVDSLNMTLHLRDFSSFYFERIKEPNEDKSKNRFLGFSTKIGISKKSD